MEVSKVNNLSFYNDQGTIVISAKQFDTGRKFIFNISNDYEMFDLTDCTAYLRIKKADGTEFQGNECCIIEDTQIIIDTSIGNGNQILAAAGSNLCEIHLTDTEGKSITTWNFVINVEPRVHNGDGIISKDSWDMMDEIGDSVKDYKKKLEEHYFVLTSDKDIANGVPSLDANKKIPSDELPVASTTLGGVKSGTDITVDTDGNVSVNDDSHKHKLSNISDVTATKDEVNVLDGITSTTSELNKLHNTTATKDDFDKLHDITATATEINVLDGITATTTELNYVDGVTSNIQDQLDDKAPLASPELTGTPKAPTATAGTNTTQIATTAFVQTETSTHNSSNTAHIDIRDLITVLTTRLNTLANSDDTTLDQLSEIVAYIKSNRTLIENVTTNKVNVSDIIDNLTSTAINKPLSAKQGKVLNDLITALTTTVNTKIDTVNGDTYIGTSKSETTTTITHKDVSRSNTTSTASPSHGGTFTAVKTVTSDTKGHVTGVDTETVTLPTYGVATQSANGLESAADKKKLDDIEAYAANIPFIAGTQTAETGSWTGTTSKISSLVDGQTIRYWLPYNGSGNATLNLTLADGSTTGAIACYWKGTSRLTHYTAGMIITLTYRQEVSIAGSGSHTGWWADADVNTYEDKAAPTFELDEDGNLYYVTED